MALTVATIETAIEVVLKQQKYRILDREYTFANLAELRQMRKDLKAEADLASTSQWRGVRFNRPTI